MKGMFRPQGVCSRAMAVELEGNVIKDVEIIGGCHGNSQGVAALVKGMTVDEAVSRLRGIRCGGKSTSCPDQLCDALLLTREKAQEEGEL